MFDTDVHVSQINWSRRGGLKWGGVGDKGRWEGKMWVKSLFTPAI